MSEHRGGNATPALCVVASPSRQACTLYADVGARVAAWPSVMRRTAVAAAAAVVDAAATAAAPGAAAWEPPRTGMWTETRLAPVCETGTASSCRLLVYPLWVARVVPAGVERDDVRDTS